MASDTTEAAAPALDAIGVPATSKVGPGKHFYWIDWLRFLAAAGVLAQHARGGNWADWTDLTPASHTKVVFAAFALTRMGQECVMAFFVISGFLVGGGTIQRVVRGSFDAGSYAVDRLTRIYVPLVPALALAWAMAPAYGRTPSIRDFAGNLVGVQGIFADVFAGVAPLWTLAYEIWFYVLAGAAASVVTTSVRNKPLALLVGAFAMGIFIKLDATYLFCWSLGMLAYSLLGALEKPRPWLLLLSIAVTVSGVAICELTSDSHAQVKSGWTALLPSASVGNLILSTGVALLLASVSRWRPGSGMVARLERMGSRWAGFSYTLYLTHYPIILLWEHRLPLRAASIDASSLARFAAKILSCLAVAMVMYLLFESRTVHVRRWLSNQLGHRQNDRLPTAHRHL